MTIRKPGIYADLSFKEYLLIDAVNCSLLKRVYSQSALHAMYERDNPSEPTPALLLGEAVHTCILEPERFAKQYCQAPNVGKRSKADKEFWDDWERENPGVTALKEADWLQVLAMSNAVLEHETAGYLLKTHGESELTFVWIDDETDLLCKARADRVTTYAARNVIVDLKTTQDASPKEFGKSIARFGYDMQAAWYLRGASALGYDDQRFLFVCVEKAPPHAVTVQELDDEGLKVGQRLIQTALDKWHTAIESDDLSDVSYPTHIIKQRLPAWRRTEGQGSES
jgi:exodeoxyribonuclease VIII